jgi:hypothetical protein
VIEVRLKGACQKYDSVSPTWKILIRPAGVPMKPNRFMETIGCLDCAVSVVNMLLGVQSHKAVVFYCDEGIKGFDAPSDDPMKEELTCNLVLCAPCMAIRRISFYKKNAGRGGRGRNSKGRK